MDWRSLGRVYKAYARNSDELLSLIAAPSAMPELAIDLMAADQENKREQYFDELFRLLHNYLSACSTLVEHSRRLMNHYSNMDFYQEYDGRKNKVGQLGVARFLQDLRNYLLHHRIPPLSIGLSIMGQADPDFTFEVILDAERLLETHDWKVDAEEYIRARDRVVLLECVEEINEKTTNLYDWLFAQFKVIHASDIEDIQPLQEEFHALLASESTHGGSEAKHQAEERN